ncbi:MAG: hypothetical protein HC842_03360 [Cytophagales bacterium]|nr:hypothetical protein [Cytophagales bacterium]
MSPLSYLSAMRFLLFSFLLGLGSAFCSCSGHRYAKGRALKPMERQTTYHHLHQSKRQKLYKMRVRN